MKYSVFTRILIMSLLPLIVIFTMVIAMINRTVYDQNVKFADEKSRAIANETKRQINDRYASVLGLLEMVNSNLVSIDTSEPNAAETASTLAKSILKATPHIYCVWYMFEPGEFVADGILSRDYVKKGDEIVEIIDLDVDILDNPELAPWYVIPMQTGKVHFESADYYDYGIGTGSQYTDTVSAPLIRNGKTIGVVGIDSLYSETFKFIDEKQLEGEQKILLISQKGDIVYSTESDYIKKSILDWPFKRKDELFNRLSKNEPFWIEDSSPFFKKHSRMYFTPVYTELASEQLYLYIDLPIDKFYGEAENAAHSIILTSVFGLIILVLSLFFTIRNIVRPIKKLTENANLIANGNLDINLDAELKDIDEHKQTKNEITILFIALKKMLNQLNQVQQLRLETMEANYEKEKAEASDRAKTEFLAKMSHEIRTPMNAIIGMTELVLRENISSAVYERVNTIKQAGATLLNIINDILDFSKIESGKLEIVPGNYLFSSLMHDVVNIIKTRVMESNLQFIVNIDSNIPNALIGDEMRIRQILMNLLSNAVKYTEAGFVAISVAGEITGENDVMLTIDVADSGQGIKEEDIGKLFDNFVQVDLVKNKGIEGTGLGLAIAKNIARQMGGDISVCSKYGKGSVFTVTFPQKFHKYEKLAVVENPEEKSVLIYERREIYANSIASAVNNLGVNCAVVLTDAEFSEKITSKIYSFVFVSSSLLQNAKNILAHLDSDIKVVLLAELGEEIAEQNLSILTMPVHTISVANILNGVANSYIYNEIKKIDSWFIAPSAKILVVDDINTNLKVAEGLMLPYKVQTDLCNSGAQAIEAIESKHYDLVFMDHMMPDMDGIETTRYIRALGEQNAYYKNLPIVALTANAVSGTKEMFLQNGFHDFLSKPIDTVMLNAILERWIPKEKQKKSMEKPMEKDDVNFSHTIVIEGVDVKKGISMTGGTVDNYLRTLGFFYKDGVGKIDEINSCLEAGNLPLYVTYVHALKSACANIGAMNLSETAKTLELAGRNKDVAFIKMHTGKFLLALEELLQKINDALSVINEKKPKNSVNLETLKSELAKLKSALEGLDFDAIDTAVNCIEKFTAEEKIGNDVENILQNILIGEYGEAELLIERLLEDKGPDYLA